MVSEGGVVATMKTATTDEKLKSLYFLLYLLSVEPLPRSNPVRINQDSVYLRFCIKHKIRNGIRQTVRSYNTHKRDD